MVATDNRSGKMSAIRAKLNPRMVLVHPTVKGNTLTLNAKGMPRISVPIMTAAPDRGQIFTFHMPELVQDTEGVDCGQEAGEWFDTFLGHSGLRLIHSAPSLRKKKLAEQCYLNTKHSTALADDVVAYADISPFQVLGEASLADLNSHLQLPVSARNFRPGLLVAGCDAYAEDDWDEVVVGNAELKGTWNCPRCIFTTVDPDTGLKSKDFEPLATLRKTHKSDGRSLDFKGQAIFGRLLMTRKEDVISVNDKVYATRRQIKQ